MTAPGPPSAPSRALRMTRGTALFVGGCLFTALAVPNVPGAENADGITDAGALLWMVAIAAWASVFVRRSHPGIVLAAGLVLAAIGLEYLLLLIGVHHAAQSWRPETRRWLWPGAGGVLLLFWVREALTPWGDRLVLTDGSDPGTATLVSGVMMAATAGVAGLLILLTRSRHAEEHQRVRADVEHSHAARLGRELALQEERSRIARDIHDGLTNRLALVSMMSGNVATAVRSSDPDAVALAEDLQSEARHALTDLRALVGDLRTEPAATRSRETSMRSVAELVSAARAAGTTVDSMVVLDDVSSASPELDEAVFRIAQESLTNAIKHAPTRTVSLYLGASPAAGARLRVSNAVDADGPPAGVETAGAGLAGMRERVDALGGTLWAGEHDGQFIVDADLPWATADSGPRLAVPPARSGARS